MAGNTTLRDRITGLIDKLGSYVHLDLRYYIRNLSYITAGQLVGAGFSVLLSIAFARLLTKDLYGQWNYILAIMGILAILSLPGMNTAIGQAVARGHDRVLTEGTKEKFKWSILGSIALLGVGTYYFMTGSTLVGKCLMISSLFFPFFENLQAFYAFLGGKKQFGKSAKYGVIIQIISISATILIIYFTRNLIVILITYLVSFSLMRGYFFRLVSKTMSSESNDKEALTFGKKMTLANIPGVISHHRGKIIAGLLLSFSDVAIFTIAQGFQRIIRSLLEPIVGLSFPKLAEMEEKEAYSAVRKRYLYLVLLTAVVAGISIALCPYIIPLFYSQRYQASVLYAQILLALLVLGIPMSMLIKALFPSQRKVKEIVKFETTRIITSTVLIIGFTLKFGLLGLVLAGVVNGIFMTIYSWWLVGWIGPKSSSSPR